MTRHKLTLEETDKFITVLEEVASAYMVNPNKIMSDARYRPLPEARQMICLLLENKIHTNKLGKQLSRDRSTVLNGRKKILDRIYIYPDTRKIYKQLIEKLGYDDQTQ